jgi:hypothetical protein
MRTSAVADSSAVADAAKVEAAMADKKIKTVIWRISYFAVKNSFLRRQWLKSPVFGCLSRIHT